MTNTKKALIIEAIPVCFVVLNAALVLLNHFCEGGSETMNLALNGCVNIGLFAFIFGLLGEEIEPEKKSVKILKRVNMAISAMYFLLLLAVIVTAVLSFTTTVSAAGPLFELLFGASLR